MGTVNSLTGKFLFT